MFERLKDKNKQPTFEEMVAYCGSSGAAWLELEKFLASAYDLQKSVRFPYGEGWGVKYAHRSKHICDVFAEDGAFTVFFRIDDKDIDNVKSGLSEYAQKVCAGKYPCGAGGWVRYRVTGAGQLGDAKKLIAAKVKPKKEVLRGIESA